jgi:hypothetical protein
VNTDLHNRLAASSSVLTRSEALAAVPAHVVENAVRTGQLVRLFPGVYADPGAVDRHARLVAAVRYGRGRAALSHTSALEVWGVWNAPDANPVHLTTAATSRFVGRGLVVHRMEGFLMSPPQVLVRQGLPVTGLEQSIVDSWPVIPAERRRELRAGRTRRTRHVGRSRTRPQARCGARDAGHPGRPVRQPPADL